MKLNNKYIFDNFLIRSNDGLLKCKLCNKLFCTYKSNNYEEHGCVYSIIKHWNDYHEFELSVLRHQKGKV